MKRWIGSLPFALVAVLAANASAATTINVTTTTDDGGAATAANCPSASCSLRDAIAYSNANAGTTIDIPAGTYDLTGTELDITAPVVITGQGAGPSDTKVVQQAFSSSRVLEINSTAGQVSISDLELSGGDLAAPAGSFAIGGGIDIDPTDSNVDVTLTHDLIDHNVAVASHGAAPGGSGDTALGGGIAIESAQSPTVVLSDTTVSHNTAQGGAGAAASATGNGGNAGSAFGGGIYFSGYGSLQLEGGTSVSNNAATGLAGGTATAGHTVGTSGVASGAGVYGQPGGGSGTVSITDTTVDDNVATGGHGANAVAGQPNGGGGSVGGGGLVVGQPTVLTDVEVDSNQALGGLSGTGGTGTGSSSGTGGGLEIAATATISQSTVAGNSARGIGPNGLADAGGVESAASTMIVNSTIASNTLTSSNTSRGGGVAVLFGQTTIASDTIDGNGAATGGANVGISGGSAAFAGTVVANPIGGANNCDATGGTISELTAGGNLEDDAGASCGFTGGSDQVGASPQLGALQNNGGPTETMLPAPGSPVIGQGGTCVDPSQSGSPALLLDQRGLPRPRSGPCDAGAVQIQAPSNTVAPSVSPAQPGPATQLTCNPGTWTGDGTLGYTYAWFRDVAQISGQSGSTYTTVVADVGHSVGCKVVAKSAGYNLSAGPVASNQVPVTAPAPSVSITAPADGASFTQGQVVDASYSCSDPSGGAGLKSCVGAVANGAAINTATVGSHSFSVTAADNAAQATTKTISYTVTAPPPPPSTVTISGLKQSYKRWHDNGKHRATTEFTFTLSAPATVTLTFKHGQKTLGTVTLHGVTGSNLVKFSGVLRRRKRLPPGRYTVTLTAVGADGKPSTPATLSFTILR